MELTFMCSQMDTDFIELLYKTFEKDYVIEETHISGITGYEMVTIVIAGVSLAIDIIALFAAQNMTATYNRDDIRSKRCLITKNNRSVSFEGFDAEEIKSILREIWK